ncbi:hypothetical protein [Haladaptatus sp. DFWS20]|uniref:hypothetical protein n=1 Tax=Haladaptatus sp. DFWS20 TaxID=3403467 RepID=UPI003EBBBE02
MGQHEATFEIHSKSDAHAVNMLMERVYDSLREESMIIEGNSEIPNEMLEAFETLRTEMSQETPGRLTLVYEDTKGHFEE